MRSKLLRNLFLSLPILAFSVPAFAGYQVTSQAGDSAAAEVKDGAANTAEFLVIADIEGSVSPVTVGLVINGDPATATYTDDFTLSFPSSCPRDEGGATIISFAATSTGASTFDLVLGSPSGGGGAVVPGGTFTCTVVINAVDDAIDEDLEDLNLTIVGNPSTVKDPLVQSFSISDNDTAALVATNDDWNGTDAIVLTQQATSESGDLMPSFWVQLATQPLANITVDLAVSNTDEALISSGGSGDVGSLELTFTTANWDTGQEVTLTGQDDNPPVQDGNIAYEITVVTTTEADSKYDNLAAGPVNAVNADNDESGQIRFTQSAQSGDEGDAITLTVERLNSSAGIVTVEYAITNGSASGTDYSDTTTGAPILTFADGVMSQDISITLLDDPLWEPTAEDFSVELLDNGNLTGEVVLLSPTTQTISINPSDEITIFVSAPDVDPVPEGDDGDANVPVSFDVTYTGGDLESPMTISWMTVDGTATSAGANPGDVDYVAVGATNINLPVDKSAVTITANVIGDNQPEGDETFLVQLSESHDLVTLDGGGGSVATIEDDDASSDGTFSITSIVSNPVMESEGSVTVTVSRIGNTVFTAATIHFATADGSAIAGEDYTDTNGSLVWAATDEDAFKTFNIPIADNEAGEPDETFSVTITAATTEVIGTGSDIVTIIGDPTVTFNPVTYNVSEDDGSVTIFVERANVDDGAVSVDYATVDGSATDGDDYVATSGTLNWTAAEFGAKSFVVTILADADDTGPESFVANLSACSNCTITAPQATINIAEGEVAEKTPGNLAFSPVSIDVGEAVGSAGVLVVRTGGTDGDITIDWLTTDGTATSPPDFTAGSGTLSWSDGEGGSKLILVAIIDDDEQEPDEDFTVSFVADSETGTEGDPTVTATPATVTIKDNDNPVPGEFSILDINVGEGDGVINVSVTRDVGSTGAVSVTYTTVSGSATGANPADALTDDYLYTTGVLNWAEDDAVAKTIAITIVDDTEVESTEVFTVVLSDPQGGATITKSSADVTISDNDGGGDFSINDVTVFETKREAVLTVTRANDNDSAAFVFWETQDGTAEDENGDNDYKSDSGELQWDAGDTSSTKTITIRIVIDDKDEGDEYFTVKLTGVQGESVTISKSDGIVVIKDPIPIPTLSQWAMGVLALLLLGLGVYSMPEKRRAFIKR